jgi:hypothetical protein
MWNGARMSMTCQWNYSRDICYFICQSSLSIILMIIVIHGMNFRFGKDILKVKPLPDAIFANPSRTNLRRFSGYNKSSFANPVLLLGSVALFFLV